MLAAESYFLNQATAFEPLIWDLNDEFIVPQIVTITVSGKFIFEIPPTSETAFFDERFWRDV